MFELLNDLPCPAIADVACRYRAPSSHWAA